MAKQSGEAAELRVLSHRTRNAHKMKTPGNARRFHTQISLFQWITSELKGRRQRDRQEMS
jgi:hypothetical protein